MCCKTGYRTDVPVQNKSAKGGVPHLFGGALISPKKYRTIWGVAAIVSQYRAIWGHSLIFFSLLFGFPWCFWCSFFPCCFVFFSLVFVCFPWCFFPWSLLLPWTVVSLHMQSLIQPADPWFLWPSRNASQSNLTAVYIYIYFFFCNPFFEFGPFELPTQHPNHNHHIVQFQKAYPHCLSHPEHNTKTNQLPTGCLPGVLKFKLPVSQLGWLCKLLCPIPNLSCLSTSLAPFSTSVTDEVCNWTHDSPILAPSLAFMLLHLQRGRWLLFLGNQHWLNSYLNQQAAALAVPPCNKIWPAWKCSWPEG